ncbi:MAG: GAF domain-containing protein [Anaerolineales bacterium]|nr:GAF domain-containing protein [Anaerolineales bacterium]
MKKSLRTRLTVYFIALVSLPLLLVGVVANWLTYTQERAYALEIQAEKAELAAERVQNFIDGRKNDLQALIDVYNFSNATFEQQSTLLSTLFAKQTVYEEIILTNGRGKELLYLSRLDVVTSQEFSNRTGADEFEKPKATGEPYFGPVIFNETTSEPYMIISIPSFNLKSGQLANVIIAKFRFKSVWDLMGQESVSESDEVYMTDSNGYVVAHANPSVVLQREQITPPAKNSFTTGLDGSSVALAVKQLKFEDQTFYILAEQPTSIALASAYSAVLLTVVVILLSMLGAGFLGLRASRQITAPIQELATSAQLISAGNLNQTTNVQSEDEIGALAESFNHMAAQLRDLVGSLEQRVADRTKALNASTEVSRRLSTILNQEQLVKEVVEQVQTAFNYYHAHIYLVDEAGDLVMAGGTGEAGQIMLERKHKVLKGRGLVGRAASLNAPVLVEDTEADSNWLPNPLLPETKSEVAVPISLGNEVLGVLDVQHNQVDGISAESSALIQSIANQVAIALKNASSYTEIQVQAKQEALISLIGQKIQNTRSVEGALQTALRELSQALGVQEARIMLNVNELKEKSGSR